MRETLQQQKTSTVLDNYFCWHRGRLPTRGADTKNLRNTDACGFKFFGKVQLLYTKGRDIPNGISDNYSYFLVDEERAEHVLIPEMSLPHCYNDMLC